MRIEEDDVSPRFTAACVIGCVLTIVGCMMWSIALLFKLSPAWGIIGCVALVHGVAATHYIGVGR